MQKTSIGFRLICMIMVLLIVTCAALTAIDVTLARRTIKNCLTPGCTESYMRELARWLAARHWKPQQVQCGTPTP